MKLVYITVPDKIIATEIAKILVQEKMAACVNIIDMIESHYIWEGKLNSSQEILILAKTTEEMLQRLIERIKMLHPYECPCIVAMDVVGGNPDFLKWIEVSLATSLHSVLI